MIGQHRLHRVKLVAANSTCTDFGTAGLRVEAPAIGVFDQRNRHCPVVCTDVQNSLSITGFFNPVLLAVMLQKCIHVFALYAFARDEAVPFAAQQLCQACLVGVLRAQCFDERFDSLFWRWKYLLCRCDTRPQQAGRHRKHLRKRAHESFHLRMIFQRRPPL
ncbi:hypothetical protein D3C81_1274520 [compost metagenome]